MKLDTDKIEELYGNDVILELYDNMDDVLLNLKYLIKKKIINVYELLDSYPYLFLEDNEIFKEKIDNFLSDLGINYIEKLENDMSLWGDLL